MKRQKRYEILLDIDIFYCNMKRGYKYCSFFFFLFIYMHAYVLLYVGGYIFADIFFFNFECKTYRNFSLVVIEPKVSPTTFCRVFPFHIMFDRDLTIVQTGYTITRILPQVCSGSCKLTDILFAVSEKFIFPSNKFCIFDFSLIVFHSHNFIRHQLFSYKSLYQNYVFIASIYRLFEILPADINL